MTVPKFLEIGPHTYTVELSKELTGEGKWGDTTIEYSRIRLHPDQVPGCMRDTLLHEALHAICENTGLAYDFREDDFEEKVIRRLAPAVLDLLRRNKRLVAFLTAP